MNEAWIDSLFAVPELLDMGHAQAAGDRNLGLGWLYYAQVRLLRPSRVVCIGSWRGFAPLVLARALQDNGAGGRLTFLDPSFVDDFWTDPERVRAWFHRFGIDAIDHHAMTTQAFVETEAYRALGPVGLLFIDGYHTATQARFDHEAFQPWLTPDAVVMFHDAVQRRISRIYGADKGYLHDVVDYIETLRCDPALQVLDFEHGAGLALVRRRRPVAAGGA